MVSSPENIAGVAIRINGEVWQLPAPARHHHIIRVWSEVHEGARLIPGSQQGFVTSTGRFVSREVAAQIAFAAGQVSRKKRALFSEDVW